MAIAKYSMGKWMILFMVVRKLITIVQDIFSIIYIHIQFIKHTPWRSTYFVQLQRQIGKIRNANIWWVVYGFAIKQIINSMLIGPSIRRTYTETFHHSFKRFNIQDYGKQIKYRHFIDLMLSIPKNNPDCHLRCKKLQRNIQTESVKMISLINIPNGISLSQ